MDKIATCQEAHSSGKGGVESVRAVTRHSRAITVHAQQAIIAIKQEGLEKACDKLLGREGVHKNHEVTDWPKTTTL